MRKDSKRLRDSTNKQLWEFILNPIKVGEGSIWISYSRHVGEMTQQYKVKYDFREKGWKINAWQFPTKHLIWRKLRTNKFLRAFLIKKAIKHLEDDLTDIRKGREA